MKFKVTITKEHIDKALMCSVYNVVHTSEGSKIEYHPDSIRNPELNCLFAVVYNELVPFVKVGQCNASFHTKDDMAIPTSKGSDMMFNEENLTEHSMEMQNAIRDFDLMSSWNNQTYLRRYEFVGKEYEFEIPDNVISYWYKEYSDFVQRLANSPTIKKLELA